MQRWWRVIALTGLAVFLAGGLWAQTGDDESDYYLDEEVRQEVHRYALGIGFGLVELGDNVIQGERIVTDDDVEQYFNVSLRIRFGDQYANQGPGNAGFRGYLEPEIGYYDGEVISDLLLGVNIIGAMPVNAVEFFLGAGVGVHFIDREPRNISLPTGTDDSDTALGFNAQFGLDVAVSKKVSVFGVGRFDLVDDDRDELEGKVYLGLRFRFGEDDD
ncbi:MAG: hypothetical protein R3325_09880 [Thermoanaerobaculia bacterium]|nr:hypothetical protein [Thermoanaerobaculia bacterium]